MSEMNLSEKIKQLADSYSDEIIEIRRHLHKNPELSFREFNTSAYITSKLEEYGIPCKGKYVKTGIVGTIEGKKEAGGKRKVIALRADMDALPITEENDVEYRSVNKGVMHACGHDAHSASLLGAAKILKELENEFCGVIKLIFQPGEELLPGGARQMLEEGALEYHAPDVFLAQHVYPALRSGSVGFKKGIYMASSDEIYITVTGKGGHAAMPEKLTDTVLIASHIIIALQQIVSRQSSSFVPTILSFGKIIGDGATNVIPNKVTIEGTFRTMDEEWRKKAHKSITDIAKETAKSMGAECRVDIVKGYPLLINDNVVTEKATSLSREYLGENNVHKLDLRMTCEDFAFFSQKYPSVYYRLGTGSDISGNYSELHTSTFNIEEDSLVTGMGLLAWLAISFATSF